MVAVNGATNRTDELLESSEDGREAVNVKMYLNRMRQRSEVDLRKCDKVMPDPRAQNERRLQR